MQIDSKIHWQIFKIYVNRKLELYVDDICSFVGWGSKKHEFERLRSYGEEVLGIIQIVSRISYT